jgi:hypothetical protein
MRIFPLASPEAGKLLSHEPVIVLVPFPTVKEDVI